MPFFNEEDGVEAFFNRVRPILQALGEGYEIVCVNDGSGDGTLAELRRAQAADRSIRIVSLTRNFGKEAALSAALDHCRGEAIVPIDADLQDPPELIAELFAKWREGFAVVVARRRRRDGEGWLKRATAHGFYRFFNRLAETSIPADVGDYRLLDRRVLEAFKLLSRREGIIPAL
ncbi:MAG: glycosyltransferase family 2 protein, partial [Verrucomicrobiota bacterium]